MDTVGNRITELREINGLSKADLAEKLGVTKSTITRYEADIMRPNLDMLLELREIFGVTLDWLVGDEKSKRQER